MKISQQVIVKRWKHILEEYEKIQNKGLDYPLQLDTFRRKIRLVT